MKTIRSTIAIPVISVVILLGLTIAPAGNAALKSHTTTTHTFDFIQNKLETIPVQEGADYFALIFAVGIYYNNPDQDRPSMLEAADDLNTQLLKSDHWTSDHIRVIKAEQATGKNLIDGLRWLDSVEDGDDVCLIYITTHGFPLKNQNGLPTDIPPKDEADGADEALVMYHGFYQWYSFIWDDLLNLFISMLESQGVCLIVDSCYSGGFNDTPFESEGGYEYTAQSFSEGMAEDLLSQGRVVLMSCRENEVSYGSYFSSYLIDAFGGIGDTVGNQDGSVSAEEAFNYAEFWVSLFGDQHPTIRDLYSGDLQITTAWA